MKLGLPFHQARIQSSYRNRSAYSSAVDGGSGHTKIEKIFSHPQALAFKGKKFTPNSIQRHKIEVTASTAYAARFISEHPDCALSSHCTAVLAEEYGLELIAEDIQEMANFTRFWVLEPKFLLFPCKHKLKNSLALTYLTTPSRCTL